MNLESDNAEPWITLVRRVCVVTGAGSGIGAETARELSNLGASVALIGREYESAASVAAQIKCDGGEALACEADVKSVDDISNVAEQILNAFGHCHILVINAALVGYGGSLIDCDTKSRSQTLDVNLTGPLICAWAFGRQMITAGRGGRIVNVASIGGRASLAGVAHTASAKQGL
jgi:NAD(P)-dependent dehydrogenase (short-subunit alcohol dehydrogenase family)